MLGRSTRTEHLRDGRDGRAAPHEARLMVVCDRLAGSGVEVVPLEDLSAPDFVLPFGPVSGWFHAVSLPGRK